MACLGFRVYRRPSGLLYSSSTSCLNPQTVQTLTCIPSSSASDEVTSTRQVTAKHSISQRAKRRHERKMLLPLVVGAPFFLSYLRRRGRAACHGSSLPLLSLASASALASPHSGAYPPFSTAASGFAFAQSRLSFAPEPPCRPTSLCSSLAPILPRHGWVRLRIL